MSVATPAPTQAEAPLQHAPSAIAVLQNKRAPVKDRAAALGLIVDGVRSDLLGLLPKHVDVDRLKQMFILNVKSVPKLLDCDPASLVKALYTAASMGLEPDPYFGQIYLLPYGANVQVIPGYKGLLQLVRNSGMVTSISAQVVHENDYFEFDMASGERPKHRPNLEDTPGKALAYYCIANFKDGGHHFELMTMAEVVEIRNRSAAVKSGKQTPWDTDFDEMAKKTVIRRAVKRLPIALTRDVRVALQADDAAASGRIIEVDRETGEVIDIWADGLDESPEQSAPVEGKPSRLESFASAEPSQNGTAASIDKPEAEKPAKTKAPTTQQQSLVNPSANAVTEGGN